MGGGFGVSGMPYCSLRVLELGGFNKTNKGEEKKKNHSRRSHTGTSTDHY